MSFDKPYSFGYIASMVNHEPVSPEDLLYVLPVLDRGELEALCANPHVIGASLCNSHCRHMGHTREQWPDDRQRAVSHADESLVHHRYWSRITDSDIELAFETWEL